MRIFVSIVLSLAVAHAQGDSWLKEPDAFKGVKFGSTENEFRRVLNVMDDDCSNNADDDLQWRMENIKSYLANVRTPRLRNRVCFYRIEVGKFALFTYFVFTDDHLRSVHGAFRPDYFGDVKEIFRDTYGVPALDEQSVVQTKTGA